MEEEQKKKKILYLDSNFHIYERYEKWEYHEVVDCVEIFSARNVDKAKQKTLEVGSFDLVGIHLSTNNAIEFARYTRNRNRDTLIVALSGMSRHYIKETLDKINFPYDQLLTRFNLYEEPKETARSLIRILSEIENLRSI